MMIHYASRRQWRLLVGLYCNSLCDSPQPTPHIQPRLLLAVALLPKPHQVQPTKASLRMENVRGRESQEPRGDHWAKIVEQRAIKNRVQYIHCR
jgi:hypothetical protein